MKNKAFILFLTLWGVLLSSNNFGQEISFGDKNVQDAVKKKVSEIYENKDKTQFFLTQKSFQPKSTCGTEITAYSKGGEYNRLVTKSCGKNGKHAAEYYFDEGNLIFAYIVFEYFDEKTRNDMWKNFKGLASWESRYYFANNNLKFHRHKGKNDITAKENGEKIKKAAYAVLKFVKDKKA